MKNLFDKHKGLEQLEGMDKIYEKVYESLAELTSSSEFGDFHCKASIVFTNKQGPGTEFRDLVCSYNDYVRLVIVHARDVIWKLVKELPVLSDDFAKFILKYIIKKILFSSVDETFVEAISSELWEIRKRNSDFFSLRLGTGLMAIDKITLKEDGVRVEVSPNILGVSKEVLRHFPLEENVSVKLYRRITCYSEVWHELRELDKEDCYFGPERLRALWNTSILTCDCNKEMVWAVIRRGRYLDTLLVPEIRGQNMEDEYLVTRAVLENEINHLVDKLVELITN